MAWIGAAIVAGAGLVGSAMQSKSQGGANKTNVKLQREQQAWEQYMSNTAVQRRRQDVEAAGFNPLLAATGPGASTPSVPPAHVEPKYKAGVAESAIAQAMAFRTQMDALKAQTSSASANARLTNAEARIKETYGNAMAELEIAGKQIDQSKAMQQISNLRLDQDMTAAQLRKFNDTVEAMIKMANQQAKAGQINLEALENIAAVGGIEASKIAPIVKTIISLFMRMSK